MVGLDGGYVRGREKPGVAGHFEVIVGRSMPEDRDSRYFGFVAAVDDKPRRRLQELLAEQGLQMNQEITFLTDGGDTVRAMAGEVAPFADHVLDWFHITMRLTVLGQYVRGLAHHDENGAGQLDRLLRRIKGLLWHGNLHDAVPGCEDLVDMALEIESDYPSLPALRKTAAEFHSYIANNADAIPSYAERHRYGERSRRHSSRRRSTSWSASASPSANRCAGRAWVRIGCSRPGPAPSTTACARSSAAGIPAWTSAHQLRAKRVSPHERPKLSGTSEAQRIEALYREIFGRDEARMA